MDVMTIICVACAIIFSFLFGRATKKFKALDVLGELRYEKDKDQPYIISFQVNDMDDFKKVKYFVVKVVDNSR